MYGVQDTGFVIPTLEEVLNEIEQSNVAMFGPGIIQTAQSPFGQWNGLRAERIRAVWELALETYQSYDVHQAEGVPLDRLGYLRLLSRQSGESDADFAKAISNRGVANTRDADFFRALANIPGVRWARIDSNDSSEVNELGMDANSVAVSALGGDDEAIALVARRFVTPGIGHYGNVTVETNIEGFCRSIRINRPTEVPTRLEVNIYKRRDRGGCPPPATAAIQSALVANLSGWDRPRNGADITRHIISRALCDLPTVEVESVQAAKNNDDLAPLPLSFGFDEIPLISLSETVINVLPD